MIRLVLITDTLIQCTHNSKKKSHRSFPLILLITFLLIFQEANKSCSKEEVCAIQHLQWPMNMSFPVCVPAKYVRGKLGFLKFISNRNTMQNDDSL